MKTVFVAALAVLFVSLQVPCVLADENQEHLAEADQYYQQGDFKKAHKAYLKLAKTGDHYSQHQVAEMYADGEGKKVNLTEAYAWSVLAAEGGQEEFIESSDELLQRVPDQKKALKKAEKLQKKYGKEALRMNAVQKGTIIKGSKCTGSKLGCRSH